MIGAIGEAVKNKPPGRPKTKAGLQSESETKPKPEDDHATIDTHDA